MADIKISQLGAAAAVVDADVIPATANGVTVKVPASVLKEYAIGGTDISSIGDGTPTGAISALKSVKIEKTDIAPIETSVTSKAYAVGDQLYYNGMLYSVIAAIAQGETLVVDTNIELSDKVTEQIKALQGSVDLVNADLQKEVTTRAALGAHNLLPNTATNIVHNGVTFIVNDDGSVTVSGTPSANPGYGMVKICDIHTTELSGKSVIMGGGSNITAHCFVNIECFNSSNTRVLDKNIMTSEELFTIPADTIRIQCHIVANTGFSGSSTAIYPMLRLASDTDPTYKPYAMTNRELTKRIKVIHTVMTFNSTDATQSVIVDEGKGYYLLGAYTNNMNLLLNTNAGVTTLNWNPTTGELTIERGSTGYWAGSTVSLVLIK